MHYEEVGDVIPGDLFELYAGPAFAGVKGRVERVLQAANAVGKRGHVVYWMDLSGGADHGKEFRSPWSFFREHARRVGRG